MKYLLPHSRTLNVLTLASVLGLVTATFAQVAQPSTSGPTNPTQPRTVAPTPRSVENAAPASGWPLARPQRLDPNRSTTADERQDVSRRALQNLEACDAGDAACLRRRQEQMRRNTPFQRQTPAAPGSGSLLDGSDSTTR